MDKVHRLVWWRQPRYLALVHCVWYAVSPIPLETLYDLIRIAGIKLHRDAMVQFRRGIGGEMCTLNLDSSRQFLAINQPLGRMEL